MIFQIIPKAEASVASLMNSVNKVILNPLIYLLFVLATVYFLIGLVKYLINPESKEVKEASKDQMLYGIIGMFIMVGVFGILNIYLNTIGEKKIDFRDNKIEIRLD